MTCSTAGQIYTAMDSGYDTAFGNDGFGSEVSAGLQQ